MVAVNNLVALSNYIDEKRNNYEEFIRMAEHLCKAEFNEYKKRIQIAKKYFDDEPLNTNESIIPKERFKRECFIHIALKQRIDAYDEAATLFWFIGNLRTISASEITNNCKVLIKKYSTDINDILINETIHFSKYLIESD